MKRVVKILLIVLAVLILIPAGGLLFLTLAAYDPPPQEAALNFSPGASSDFAPETLRILTWNLGYAGLDKNSDFILDGGVTSRPPNRETVEANLKAIGDFLTFQDSDVYFLQEVDKASSRTWKIDQTAFLKEKFPGFSGWYGRNYKAPFVPFPPKDPIGTTDSGIVTLTRFAPKDIPGRHQLPGEYSWPVRTVHLKRCAVITRIPTPEPGKDWCLINVHLSAYGDGSLRAQQLGYIKEWMVELYEEGHYVVLGGDWNSLFPGIHRDHFTPFTTPEELTTWIQRIPEGWTPADWRWCFDPQVATNRSLEKSFVRGENLETIIDGFLVSPNIEVKEIQGFDLAFESSDHNPLAITLGPARQF